MESLILNKYSTSKTGHFHPNYNRYKVHLCRYADDFIVTADNKETLEEIKSVLQEFLEKRGLELSKEKTMITNIDDGFDFLGWNFRKFKGKLLIHPSNKSKKKVTEKLSQTIKYHRQSKQDLLITKLNEITKGWAEYHHCVCAKCTFMLIDHKIWEMLWKWAKRRHPRKPHRWIRKNYWHAKGNRQWIFRTNKTILFHMADMPIVRIKSLNRNANPFIDVDYFRRRKEEHKRERQRAYKFSAAALGEYYAL